MNRSSIKERALIWWKAGRPKTLVASLSPIILGTFFAFQTGHFNIYVALATLCAGVTVQIGTNFANDYFDFIKGVDTPQRKGDIRPIHTKQVTPDQMKKAALYAFATTLVFSSYLAFITGPIIMVIAVVSILLGWGYSGGPFPLAYLGLADIFVLICFGPLAVGLTYYLQTNNLPYSILIIALSPGLLSTALLTVNNLRDIEEDSLSGKKTTSVRWGARWGKVEYTLSLIGAALIPSLYGYYLPLLILIPAWVPLKIIWQIEDKKVVNKALKKTAVLSFLFCLLLILSML